MKIKEKFSKACYIVVHAFIVTWAWGQKPAPTPAQKAWHEQEYYWFLHFGPNTFTGKEWGHGDENPGVFNPTWLDTDQWCRIAKAAGATGMIITAKHHDGFCLWPSQYSHHTIKQSPWENGQGDILKYLSASCKKYGLNFGVYLSPWDRNHPSYGTAAYNEVYINSMKEILTQYGPIWELWWDGANGEGPNGKKQEYDFARFEQTVRSLSPNTLIFSDVGPDIRWVGNEKGYAGITNWNTLNTEGFTPGEGAPPPDTLLQGNRFGARWVPAEVDVSIRPGWFYRESENNQVKGPDELMKIYLESVGRGANLLLNVPPDNRGLIHEIDSAAVMQFAALRQALNKNIAAQGQGYYQSKADKIKTSILNDGNPDTWLQSGENAVDAAFIKFKKPKKINTVILRENLDEGQVCDGFQIFLSGPKKQKLTLHGTTIGRKRILTFPAMMVKSIQLCINNMDSRVRIAEIAASLIDEKLVEQLSE